MDKRNHLLWAAILLVIWGMICLNATILALAAVVLFRGFHGFRHPAENWLGKPFAKGMATALALIGLWANPLGLLVGVALAWWLMRSAEQWLAARGRVNNHHNAWDVRAEVMDE